MFALIGIVIVIGAIVGGYLMEKGNMAVLLQPAELIIIGGAALGTLLIANPIYILTGMMKDVMSILKGSRYTQSAYLETLQLLSELFTFAKREGPAKLEAEIETPEDGTIFKKYPLFASDPYSRNYICDTLRMMLSGGVTPHDAEIIMESDAEVYHHQKSKPTTALTTVADALPGLGIVAAVLGVVITMGSIGGPPAEIGHKVAAALVGTFLGILLCYGFIGPLASNITKIHDETQDFHRVLRVGVTGYLKGMPIPIATESARRMIPPRVRPSMKEMEEALRAAKEQANGQ